MGDCEEVGRVGLSAMMAASGGEAGMEISVVRLGFGDRGNRWIKRECPGWEGLQFDPGSLSKDFRGVPWASADSNGLSVVQVRPLVVKCGFLSTMTRDCRLIAAGR